MATPPKRMIAMSNGELKERLISKILLVENPNILREAIRLLDIESGAAEMVQLSEMQKEAILSGQEDIRKGNFLTNEQANKEIDEWLSE